MLLWIYISIKNLKHQVLNKTKHDQKKSMIDSKKLTDNKLNVNNNIMIETNNYLNYIEINIGSLDLVIKFPSGSKVAMVQGKTKLILQQSKYLSRRCV